MESELQSRLRNQTPRLTSSLAEVHVQPVALKMWSTGDLNLEEYESIKSSADGHRAVTKLLELVFRRGDTSIKSFANALRSIELTKLADELYSEVSSFLAQRPQQQYFFFGEASSSTQCPFDCHGVALTNDGRLLLAAGGHGMIELCSDTLVEVSRWLPPKRSFLFISYEDDVRGVAAMSDRRTAVCLRDFVVLLKRSEKGSGKQVKASGYSEWTEDHRINLLMSYATCLSAHRDVLVVAGGWTGTRLQLMTNISGRWLSAEMQRPYEIRSMAVAAKVIVTVSKKPEKHGFWCSFRVMDAHSVTDSDELLWRRELSFGEQMRGICADTSGECLYAAVCETTLIPPRCTGRVSILSPSDGRELQRIALSFGEGPLGYIVPEWLSVRDYEAAELQQPQDSSTARGSMRYMLLAVTSWYGTLAQVKQSETTVTVHRSTMCVSKVPQ